jgi:hypothetical protein
MLTGGTGYGLLEPRSPAGHLVFHMGYSFPPTRPTFLPFYQWTLSVGEGGYLPASIDQFLTDRLWESEGSREFTAIVDFQIRQDSGRWGEAPSQAHETLKIKIIDSVINRLDTMPTSDALSAMVFVESLRRGTTLRKGGFTSMYFWNESGTHLLLDVERFILANKCFKAWWLESKIPPKDRLVVNPLTGTELRIEDGP